ncbi:PLD nuclease N-terminal domain-containing protein [Virgibacillus soli]|uniref:PLD nuclease N-terminal domain-containing protein n=1 Tax=Paracerasibacillus soli TaxID=480284 RepID=A0ABU5CMS3_9BACI|nr:PLD nuclease N-terminal domain-containing protein [Virgibacillus soli]MDY0407540.1 PLD nuclease N-terminal domain-containing protein [Virgibacillus soli]
MDILQSINWGIIAPLLIIQGILIIVAIIDWAKRDETNGPKWLWLLIILFISTLGPILYFIFGRNNDA